MSLGIYNDDCGLLIGGKLKGALNISKLKDGSYDIVLNVNSKDTNKFILNDKIFSLKVGESKEIDLSDTDIESNIIPFERFFELRKRRADFDELYDLEHPDKNN